LVVTFIVVHYLQAGVVCPGHGLQDQDCEHFQEGEDEGADFSFMVLELSPFVTDGEDFHEDDGEVDNIAAG
jgi:hypothetical protein